MLLILPCFFNTKVSVPRDEGQKLCILSLNKGSVSSLPLHRRVASKQIPPKNPTTTAQFSGAICCLHRCLTLGSAWLGSHVAVYPWASPSAKAILQLGHRNELSCCPLLFHESLQSVLQDRDIVLSIPSQPLLLLSD